LHTAIRYVFDINIEPYAELIGKIKDFEWDNILHLYSTFKVYSIDMDVYKQYTFLHYKFSILTGFIVLMTQLIFVIYLSINIQDR